MDSNLWALLIPSVFLIAILYSSVGHGGASGYLAVLALAGFARPDITPVALVLNILVAATGFLQYYNAGHFRPRLLFPFVIASIPGSFIGGMIPVNEKVYAGLLGTALLAAALRFLLLPRPVTAPTPWRKGPTYGIGLPVGLLLGILSGMVGVGGGIFLSPLLLFLGWADVKKTAAVSAGFIVLNSMSGLAAHILRGTPPAGEICFPLSRPFSSGVMSVPLWEPDDFPTFLYSISWVWFLWLPASSSSRNSGRKRRHSRKSRLFGKLKVAADEGID